MKTRPHTVCLQQLGYAGGNINLTIGLDDGSVLKSSIDSITGQVSTSSSPTRRFLGVRPVTVLRAKIQNQPSTLMLSSRPWITRYDERSTGSGASVGHSSPLSYMPFDHACMLRSEIIPEGIVATSGTTMRILTLEEQSFHHPAHNESVFNANNIPLRYTPRGMCLCNGMLAVVEADVNEYGEDDKKKLGFGRLVKGGNRKDGKTPEKERDDMEMDMDEDIDDDMEEDVKSDTEETTKEEDHAIDDNEDENLAGRRTVVRGPVPAKVGAWGSCIRLINPRRVANAETSDSSSSLVELDKNEAALCCDSVQFHTRGGESLLAVGTVTGFVPETKYFSAAHIILYRMVDVGGESNAGAPRLQLLHKTKVENPPLALAQFQGRLLAGVGPTLR
ncbi:MAG: hypothetical protein ACREOZ_02330, partial [Gloeomargaritales cyanobacterium]